MKLFLKLLFREPYHLLKGRRQMEFMRLALLYGDSMRYQQQQVSFLNYRFTVPDTLSFINQYREIFADESYRFFSARPDPVVFDCGSNVGLSCLYFKSLYPSARITAFEADAAIAGYLENNLKNNGIAGVDVIKKAVWTDGDGIDIALEGADGASIFSDRPKTHVPSVRLKDMLEKYDSIDMLKMDIEGAEADVLTDCQDSLSRVNNMFIEYHSFLNGPQRLDEVLSILRRNGFRYFLKQAQYREQPLINRTDKNFQGIDLLINIFAYKSR